MFTREKVCLYSHSTKLIVWVQKGAQFKQQVQIDHLTSLINEFISGRGSAEAENKKPLLNTWKREALELYVFWKSEQMGRVHIIRGHSCSVPRIFHLCSHISLTLTHSVLRQTCREGELMLGLGSRENPKDPRTGLDFSFLVCLKSMDSSNHFIYPWWVSLAMPSPIIQLKHSFDPFLYWSNI